MAANKSSRRIHPEDLVVNPEARPGWISGAERVPSAGEEVFCAGGSGSVLRVLGKTGDGSRLLEVKLDDADRPSFAAASNVLVPRKAKRVAAA